MERIFKVYENDLIELIRASMMFYALESGGVDNWEWYGESLRDFLNENASKDDNFETLAEQELKNYEEVGEDL